MTGDQSFFRWMNMEVLKPPQPCLAFPSALCLRQESPASMPLPPFPILPSWGRLPRMKARGRSLSNAMCLKSCSNKFIVVLKTKTNSVVSLGGC